MGQHRTPGVSRKSGQSSLRRIEFAGQAVALPDERVVVSPALLDEWVYLAQLAR